MTLLRQHALLLCFAEGSAVPAGFSLNNLRKASLAWLEETKRVWVKPDGGIGTTAWS